MGTRRKTIAFTARGVAAEVLPELESQVVVLAEDPDGDDGPRLEIQRGLPGTDTDQDRRLGQDTYCLSTQTGATVYGGVRSYAFEGSLLTMRLDRRAWNTLGVPEEFSIRLEADADTLAKVRAALLSILGPETGAKS
jgi:hypothetical protein